METFAGIRMLARVVVGVDFTLLEVVVLMYTKCKKSYCVVVRIVVLIRSYIEIENTHHSAHGAPGSCVGRVVGED